MNKTIGAADIQDSNDKGFSPSWWDVKANEISNFFAGICALMIGCFFFVLIIKFTGYFSQESSMVKNTGTVIGIIIAAALISFIIMSFFDSKYRKYLDDLEKQEDLTGDYVLSDWSIKTLEFALIPRDITGYLKKILKAANNPPQNLSEMKIEDGWLEELKKGLGTTRVNEFESTILKYTRRENAN